MVNQMIAAIDAKGVKRIMTGLFEAISGSKSDNWNGFFYDFSWELQMGRLDLLPADDIIRLTECHLKTDISFGWSIDLDDVLPELCFPRICVWTPWGTKCTPRWCVDWPTITIGVFLPTIVSEISVDFSVRVEHDIGDHQWVIRGLVNPITLDIDVVDLAGTAVELFKDKLGGALDDIPYIGSYLEDAISWIIENVVDLIDDLLEIIIRAISDSLRLHPKLSVGLELHRVDELFEVVPANEEARAVIIRISDMDAEITSEKELVVTVQIEVPS